MRGRDGGRFNNNHNNGFGGGDRNIAANNYNTTGRRSRTFAEENIQISQFVAAVIDRNEFVTAEIIYANLQQHHPGIQNNAIFQQIRNRCAFIESAVNIYFMLKPIKVFSELQKFVIRNWCNSQKPKIPVFDNFSDFGLGKLSNHPLVIEKFGPGCTAEILEASLLQAVTTDSIITELFRFLRNIDEGIKRDHERFIPLLKRDFYPASLPGVSMVPLNIYFLQKDASVEWSKKRKSSIEKFQVQFGDHLSRSFNNLIHGGNKPQDIISTLTSQLQRVKIDMWKLLGDIRKVIKACDASCTQQLVELATSADSSKLGTLLKAFFSGSTTTTTTTTTATTTTTTTTTGGGVVKDQGLASERLIDGPHEGFYLSGYPSCGYVFKSLEDAVAACAANPSCNGVTMEKKNRYTLRTGKNLEPSPKGEISWLYTLPEEVDQPTTTTGILPDGIDSSSDSKLTSTLDTAATEPTFDGPHIDYYLFGHPTTDYSFDTLELAKEACIKNPLCNGITFYPSKNNYSIRFGKRLTDSTVGESSWLLVRGVAQKAPVVLLHPAGAAATGPSKNTVALKEVGDVALELLSSAPSYDRIILAASDKGPIILTISCCVLGILFFVHLSPYLATTSNDAEKGQVVDVQDRFSQKLTLALMEVITTDLPDHYVQILCEEIRSIAKTCTVISIGTDGSENLTIDAKKSLKEIKKIFESNFNKSDASLRNYVTALLYIIVFNRLVSLAHSGNKSEVKKAR